MSDELFKDFKKILRDGTSRAGVTFSEYEKACGLPKGRIAKILSMDKDIDIGTLARLLHPLGIHPCIVDGEKLETLRCIEGLAARVANLEGAMGNVVRAMNTTSRDTRKALQ